MSAALSLSSCPTAALGRHAEITGLSPQRDPARYNVTFHSPQTRAWLRREFGPRESWLGMFRNGSEDGAGRPAGHWRRLALIAALYGVVLVAPAAAQARDLVVYGEPGGHIACVLDGIVPPAPTRRN